MWHRLKSRNRLKLSLGGHIIESEDKRVRAGRTIYYYTDIKPNQYREIVNQAKTKQNPITIEYILRTPGRSLKKKAYIYASGGYISVLSWSTESKIIPFKTVQKIYEHQKTAMGGANNI